MALEIQCSHICLHLLVLVDTVGLSEVPVDEII